MPLILVSPYRLKAFFDGYMGTVQFTLPLTNSHPNYFSSVSNQAVVDMSGSILSTKADYASSTSNPSTVDMIASAPSKAAYASSIYAEDTVQMSSITTH